MNDLSRDLAACVEALADEITACCGRRECGGECGVEWRGMVPTFEAMEAAHAFLRTHAPAIAELQARCEAQTAQLAECFRLAGADPDGNEDWRIATRAVEAVRDLRRDYDESEDWQARCEAAERDAERMRQDAREIYAQIPQLPITPETCDAATDAITRFCIDFNDAIDASRGGCDE